MKVGLSRTPYRTSEPPERFSVLLLTTETLKLTAPLVSSTANRLFPPVAPIYNVSRKIGLPGPVQSAIKKALIAHLAINASLFPGTGMPKHPGAQSQAQS